MAIDNELISSISIMQDDGSYETRLLKVQGENVIGIVDKSTKDKNDKDITTYIAGISKSAKGISIENGAGTSSSVNLSMIGASSETTGASGFVPAPSKGEQKYFLRGDGAWANSDYTGQDGIEVNSGNRVIKLESLSGLIPGTYGPDTDVTGGNGVTIEVPEVTVDKHGRITEITTHTLTNQNTTYSNGSGITLTGTTFGLDNHSSTTETYGSASSTLYGHVKINDTYNSEITGNGIAASQKGLYNSYNTLNNSINTLSSSVDSSISSINTRINAQSSEISSLTTITNNHTNSLNNIDNNINTINKTKDYLLGTVICIGDSYLQGYNPDGNTTPWGTRLKDWCNISSYYSFASGGAGFVNIGQNNKRFEDLLTDAINTTSINKNNVSLIIFGGGYNDAAASASSSDIYSHMQICKTLIRNNYPNAKIVVAFIGNAQYPSSMTYDKLYNCMHRYGNASASNGFTYLSKCGLVLKGSVEQCICSDGVHPTEIGQQQIAMAILNGIGIGDNYLGVNPNFSYSSSNNILVMSDNESVIIDFYVNHNYDITTQSITCDGTNNIISISLPNIYIRPLMGNQYLMFYANLVMQTTDNKYYHVQGYLRFRNDGTMTIAPHAISEDHTGYLTVNNCKRIIVLPQVITIPRILC